MDMPNTIRINPTTLLPSLHAKKNRKNPPQNHELKPQIEADRHRRTCKCNRPRRPYSCREQTAEKITAYKFNYRAFYSHSPGGASLDAFCVFFSRQALWVAQIHIQTQTHSNQINRMSWCLDGVIEIHAERKKEVERSCTRTECLHA